MVQLELTDEQARALSIAIYNERHRQEMRCVSGRSTGDEEKVEKAEEVLDNLRVVRDALTYRRDVEQ